MEYDIVLGVWVFTHDVSAQDFAVWLGKNKQTAEDLAYYVTCLDVAYSMIDDVLRSARVSKPCPTSVYRQIVCEVTNEVLKRRNSSVGQDQGTQYTQGGSPIRGPRDPLAQVRPILNRYAGFGIA